MEALRKKNEELKKNADEWRKKAQDTQAIIKQAKNNEKAFDS